MSTYFGKHTWKKRNAYNKIYPGNTWIYVIYNKYISVLSNALLWRQHPSLQSTLDQSMLSVHIIHTYSPQEQRPQNTHETFIWLFKLIIRMEHILMVLNAAHESQKAANILQFFLYKCRRVKTITTRVV